MCKITNSFLKFDILVESAKIIMFGEVLETNEFKVIDTKDFWQTEKTYKTKEDAITYANKIKNCTTVQELWFHKWCEKDGLREGSLIQFEDGKQGVILGKDFAEGCLKYSPIKKDGYMGKSKRNLYGNLKYKIIKY